MRDPAFLFYSDNFLSGTTFFSDEQVGRYIRLLCLQHQHGHLTEKQMLFICKSYDEDIFKKFIKDNNGNYYNERLENEVFKRKKYSESRKNNRLKGLKIKKKGSKKISKSYDIHMGNGIGNENINENKVEIKNIIYPFTSENFLNWWDRWKKYKKVEHKFTFKSEISEQASLKKLSELAENEEQTAIKIIETAIANGWKGFFELKTNHNGKQQGATIEQLARIAKDFDETRR